MGKREEIAALFPGDLRKMLEGCSLDFEPVSYTHLTLPTN